MPTKPQAPCRFPGCAKRAAPGKQYCAEHFTATERKRHERLKDDECEAFYHTGTWKRLRADVLREEPLCRECAKRGIVKAAQMVDHIVPIRQGGDKMSKGNLQPLCRACHERKTIDEGGRW